MRLCCLAQLGYIAEYADTTIRADAPEYLDRLLDETHRKLPEHGRQRRLLRVQAVYGRRIRERHRNDSEEQLRRLAAAVAGFYFFLAVTPFF